MQRREGAEKTKLQGNEQYTYGIAEQGETGWSGYSGYIYNLNGLLMFYEF
jgi:hypothetical protein